MIGILPCAGLASRIDGLPKFILPAPGGYLLNNHRNLMSIGGCNHVIIGSSPGNMNTLERYAPGLLVYLAEHYATMTQTVLSGRKYTADHDILFGMADTYFEDIETYVKLADKIAEGADVAVALFQVRTGQHLQGGMCRVYKERVIEVVDKPDETDIQWIWGALAWRPVFWQYLRPDEPHVGFALPRAIAKLKVQAVICDGNFWDCGTPERYFEMIAHLQAEKVTDG